MCGRYALTLTPEELKVITGTKMKANPLPKKGKAQARGDAKPTKAPRAAARVARPAKAAKPAAAAKRKR